MNHLARVVPEKVHTLQGHQKWDESIKIDRIMPKTIYTVAQLLWAPNLRIFCALQRILGNTCFTKNHAWKGFPERYTTRNRPTCHACAMDHKCKTGINLCLQLFGNLFLHSETEVFHRCPHVMKKKTPLTMSLIISRWCQVQRAHNRITAK